MDARTVTLEGGITADTLELEHAYGKAKQNPRNTSPLAQMAYEMGKGSGDGAGASAEGARDVWGSNDNLVKSATTPGKGGVSPVGRAFQKHAGNPSRAGTFVGEVSGNAARNTEQGSQYITDILSNPQTTYKVRHTDAFGDILDVRLPDGTGARWSADGKTFIGFLEKYTK